MSDIETILKDKIDTFVNEKIDKLIKEQIDINFEMKSTDFQWIDTPTCPSLSSDEYLRFSISKITLAAVQQGILRTAPPVPVQSIIVKTAFMFGSTYDFIYEIPVGYLTDDEFKDVIEKRDLLPVSLHLNI